MQEKNAKTFLLAFTIVFLGVHSCLSSPIANKDNDNSFKSLFNLTRQTLFPGRNVCIPHPVSVSAGIAWTAHPISDCDICRLLRIDVSSPEINTCHNISQPNTSQCCTPGKAACEKTYAPEHKIDDIITPYRFSWCVENYGQMSPYLGEIPTPLCGRVIQLSQIDNGLTHEQQSDFKAKTISDCVYDTKSWFNWLSIINFCRIPALTGTYWLCGSSAFSELPARFNGRCSLIYLLPAMRPQSTTQHEAHGKVSKDKNLIVLHSSVDTPVSLDVPSACGPVNCNTQVCTWYKNSVVLADSKYHDFINTKLHLNGTLEMSSPTKGLHLLFQESQERNKTMTSELLSLISRIVDTDGTFTFEVNSVPCHVKYLIQTRTGSHIPAGVSLVADPNPCIEHLTCVQTFWTRFLGGLIPNYGVMLALDQIRGLAHSIEKLANDTAQSLGVIATTLQSHRLMILQNRVALDYVLAQQGGTCSVIGPECCSDVVDPTTDLDKYIKELENLRDRVSHIDQVDTDWFYSWFGSWWIYVRDGLLIFITVCIIIFLTYVMIRCFCFCASKQKHVQVAHIEIEQIMVNAASYI